MKYLKEMRNKFLHEIVSFEADGKIYLGEVIFTDDVALVEVEILSAGEKWRCTVPVSRLSLVTKEQKAEYAINKLLWT
jgi:hypothetical protein